MPSNKPKKGPLNNDTHMRRIYSLIALLGILLVIGVLFTSVDPKEIPTQLPTISPPLTEQPIQIIASSSPTIEELPPNPEPLPILTQATIEIKNKGKAGFYYDPASLQVVPGTTVTILNNAKIVRDIEPKEIPQYHKFTVQPGKTVKPSNVSPRLKTGDSWTFTLPEPGRYVVANSLHAGTIIIIVLEPSQSLSPITGNAVYGTSKEYALPLAAVIAFIMIATFAILTISQRRKI